MAQDLVAVFDCDGSFGVASNATAIKLDGAGLGVGDFVQAWSERSMHPDTAPDRRGDQRFQIVGKSWKTMLHVCSSFVSLCGLSVFVKRSDEGATSVVGLELQ